jgi:hypothetical protein
MRVQLQQQTGGRTIHHASVVLRAAGGVTVEQLVAALRELWDSGMIPGGERGRAELAMTNARMWVEARPPAGVVGRFSKSFYFDRLHPWQSWRFDVEGLSGYNLQR